MKRLFKIIGYVVLGWFLLLLLLGLVSQTALFRAWLKDRVLELAHRSLNGRIEIASVRGNLFTRLEVDSLTLALGGEPVLELRHARFRYNPLALLVRRIRLREITLEEPRLHLVQSAAGTWNVSHLLGAADTTAADTSRFDWVVSAPEVRLTNARVEIRRPRAGNETWRLPERIERLNARLGVWGDARSFRLTLDDLSFVAQKPNLRVRTLTTHVLLREADGLTYQARLETAGSRLASVLEVTDLDTPEVDFEFKGSPISLAEVRRLAPTVNLYGNPHLEIEVSGPLRNLRVGLRVRVGSARLAVRSRLQLAQPPFEYWLSGQIQQLDLAQLLHRRDWPTDLNARFEAQGVDWQNAQRHARIEVTLDSSVVIGHPLDRATLVAHVQHDSVRFALESRAAPAELHTEGWSTLGSPPHYQVALAVRRLDLARYLPRLRLPTNLSFAVHARGRGAQPESMNADLLFRLFPSTVKGVRLDSVVADLKLRDQVFAVRRFQVASPAARVRVAGRFSAKRKNHLTLNAEILDLSVVRRAVAVDSLRGSGLLAATLTGPLDSLAFRLNADSLRLGTAAFELHRGQTRLSGVRLPTGTHFRLTGSLPHLAVAAVDSLQSTFEIDHRPALADFRLTLNRGTDLEAQTRGSVLFDSTGFRVQLEALTAQVLQESWRIGPETPWFDVRGGTVRAQTCLLRSEDQSVELAGRLSLGAASDLTLRLRNVDLSRWYAKLRRPAVTRGRLNARFRYTGTWEAPSLHSEVEVLEPAYEQLRFDRFHGTFDFEPHQFRWDCVLSQTHNDSLFQSSGFLPVEFHLRPLVYRVLRDQPLEFKFNSRGLDLAVLEDFVPGVKNLGGTLVADIVLRNTLDDLRGVGPIRLFDGQFDIPELGTRYRQVNLAAFLNGQALDFRDLRLKSGKGWMKLEEGRLSLSQQGLGEFSLKLGLSNFLLTNNRKMRAVVEGGLVLTGSLQSPYVSGEVTVVESSIFYPAWLEEITPVKLSRKPFFVISDDSTEFEPAGARRFLNAADAVDTDFTESRLYRSLRGELLVRFRRDSWVRSPDTNLELGGELVVVKEEDELLLFGSLRAIRGYYMFFGNRFQVERGELVFYGEPEPDPAVDIEAVYTFRETEGEDRKKHEFRVFVTGTLFEPQFRFTLDGTEARQEDILSILIFGKRSESLTFGQRQSVSGDNAGFSKQATGVITNQVLQQLSGRLGRELGLDVLQIESGANFEETRVRIGKYVTPDVFVSLSQDFTAEGNQKVELEYEIPKKILFFNLLLQASQASKGESGLDVIWKIEW